MIEEVEKAGMLKVRRSAAFYFAVQGVGVFAWWFLLIFYPRSRAAFSFEPGRDTALLAFWLPDLIFIAIGSLTASILIIKRNSYSSAAMWLVTGAVSYSALYITAFAYFTGHGWLGVIFMMPAMLWSGVFSTAMTVKNDMFREARPSSANYILVKTFTQILVVWTVVLAVIPYLISLVENLIAAPRLEFAYQRPLAALVFFAISSIGVWSAVVMSRIGKGTPLPLDHAAELVIAGPYKYVRNPMAISGVGQGLAVALYLGSPLVTAYALMGSLIWQLIFRPLEEDDLSSRFGEEFEEYRRAVKCWFPRLSAYEGKKN